MRSFGGIYLNYHIYNVFVRVIARLRVPRWSRWQYYHNLDLLVSPVSCLLILPYPPARRLPPQLPHVLAPPPCTPHPAPMASLPMRQCWVDALGADIHPRNLRAARGAGADHWPPLAAYASAASSSLPRATRAGKKGRKSLVLFFFFFAKNCEKLTSL